MSVRLAPFYSTVAAWLPVRVTVNTIELDFIVVHYASAKGAAQIMTMMLDFRYIFV